MRISNIYTRRWIDICLAVVAIVSAWLMLAASDDPLLPMLRGTLVEVAVQQFGTGNQIIFGLSVGVLSAVGMFYVLVRLPEYERKQRIKQHLQRAYVAFKTSCIKIFVGKACGSYDSETIEQLMNPSAFRAYFQQPFAVGQDRWDGVANRMDESMLKQIVLEAEVLHGGFQHAMSAIDIRDPEMFAFFKHVSEALFRAKDWSANYDGSKVVLQFFWQVLAGWNPITGYSNREYVLDLIGGL
jgi:hypothetical protein